MSGIADPGHAQGTPLALTARHVAWHVGSSCILHDVDAVCPAGEVVGLIGPNGSGKTSLLHLLAGLRRPTRGRVLLDGGDLGRLGARDRARRLALVEQDATTTLGLTVRDVVALGRIPHRSRLALGLPTERHDPVVEHAMEQTDVAHLADRAWSTLSGGERQRTQLARALAQSPGVLLLDEPTNHLDLGHQLDFLSLVRDLGRTVVAALHDLNLAAAFCDRLVVLSQGRLVAQGPVAEVLTADLVAEVYGVVVRIETDELTGRPWVQWTVPGRRTGTTAGAGVLQGSRPR